MGSPAVFAYRGLAVVLAGGLAWLAFSQSLALALEDRRPEIALAVRPAQAEALSTRNQALVSDALTPAAVVQARQTVSRSVAAAPLDNAGLRDLAALDAFAGDNNKAKALMVLASKRNRRDTTVQQWLYYRALAEGDFSGALDALDPLLRREAVTPAMAAPGLLPYLNEPPLLDALAGKLAAGPRWRTDMLRYLAPRAADPAAVIAVFDRMAALGAPATNSEKSILIGVLQRTGDLSGAANIAGAAAGKITDGQFDGSPVVEPFNWVLTTSGSVFAERAAGPRGDSALRVEWPGEESVSLVQQTVLVSPGRYQITGAAMVENFQRGGWISWLVSCQGDPTPLAEARETGPRQWRTFSMQFAVSAACPALLLRLETVGADSTGQALAWYDNIVLTRLAD